MYPGVFFEDWMKSLMDIRAPTVEKLYKCLELPPLQLTDSRLAASKASGRAAKVSHLVKQMLATMKGSAEHSPSLHSPCM